MKKKVLELKDLVTPLKDSKMIPKNVFQNSAMVWVNPGNYADSWKVMDRWDCCADKKDMYPALTVQELNSAISGMGEMFKNLPNLNSPSLALKLWFACRSVRMLTSKKNF